MLSGTRHTQINVPVNTSDVPSTLAINPNGKPIVAAAVGYQAKAGEQLYWGRRRGLSCLMTLRLDSLSRAHVTTARSAHDEGRGCPPHMHAQHVASPQVPVDRSTLTL